MRLRTSYLTHILLIKHIFCSLSLMSNDKLINFCFGKFAIYDHVYVCYGLNIKVYFHFFEIYLERWLKRFMIFVNILLLDPSVFTVFCSISLRVGHMLLNTLYYFESHWKHVPSRCWTALNFLSCFKQSL